MGCCCQRLEEEDEEAIKISLANESGAFSPQNRGSDYWRKEGKILFNSKNFEKAIEAYQNALKCDPMSLVNYTNLALAMKSYHKFYQSIETIDRMLGIPSYEMEAEKVIVKGKIIRARCQTILTKNFCVQQDNAEVEKPNSFAEARKLINSAIEELKNIDEGRNMGRNFASFNAGDFLLNAKKVQQYLNIFGKKGQENDQLLKYLIKRVKQPQAKQEKAFQKVSQIVEDPLQIIPLVEHWRTKKNKLQIIGDQEEEFITDPITYDRLINPILLKSGQTYEESSLKKHYQKNGTHDPITREQLGGQLGVMNKNLAAFISESIAPLNKDDLIFRQY